MKSLQSKIILLIVFIMLVTGGIIISVSNKEIGDAMLNQQNTLSKHVLSLIELNIKGGYHNLIIDKIDSVTRYKAMLRNRMSLILEMIHRQNAYNQGHGLSQDNSRQFVLNWISGSKNAMGQAFVADRDLKILSHSDPALKGVRIADFKDMKHKTIAESLASEASIYDSFISVVNWDVPGREPSKVLICIQRYPAWNWILGTVVKIDDIEVEARRKLDNIVKTLEKTFKEIRIAKTGFAFVFDRDFNILAISDENTSETFRQALNSRTGKPLLQDLADSSDGKAGKITYESKRFGSGEMIAYVSYFKPLGWHIGITVPTAEIKRPAMEIVSKQSIYIGLILLGAVLLTAWLVSRMSKPLNVLAGRVKEFSKTDLSQDKNEDEDEDVYIQSLAETYRDEVGRLADAFVFMKKELKENIKRLIDTTAKNERIQGELNIAKDIQLGLLPKIFPPFPERDDIDIYASLEPAKEVGGDLYDFFFIDEKKLCFTIGDVSGKGVPAALMMAITKTLIKTSASKNISPADVMTEVNDAISIDNPQSMFVTLLIGVLDIETGEISYANGGHNPPIHICSDKDPYYVKASSGPLVGIMDGVPYGELSLTLKPGESLFMYTDGVTEAQNPKKEFYSEEVLMEKVSGMAAATSKEVIHAINADITVFADVEPQFDDMTMLMIKYRGA